MAPPSDGNPRARVLSRRIGRRRGNPARWRHDTAPASRRRPRRGVGVRRGAARSLLLADRLVSRRCRIAAGHARLDGDSHNGHRCGRRSSCPAADDVASRVSHRESDGCAAGHGRRRRRPEEPFLPFLGQHERERGDSRQLLHDLRELRAMPSRHLRAVALLRAPFLLVQQPVVPEVDRVHAGRRRNAAVEVVRRLPRSRRLLQRAVRSSDQGADRHAGGASGLELHVVPLDHQSPQLNGPGGFRDRISAAPRPRRERQPDPAARS